MKRKFCVMLSFLCVLFLSIKAFADGNCLNSNIFCISAVSLSSYFKNVRVIVYGSLLLLAFIFVIFSIKTAIKKERKIKITFKDEGKIVKKCAQLICFDNKKIIFEDKTMRYECSPDEIIKIKKINKNLVFFIIVFIFGIFLAIIDSIILYKISIDESEVLKGSLESFKE